MGRRERARDLSAIAAVLGIAASCAVNEPTSSPLAPSVTVQTNSLPADAWTPIPLGLPNGYSYGSAYDINNAGVVVGDALGGSYAEPFMWSAATGFRRLPTTTALPYGSARAINNEGVIIGTLFAGGSGPRKAVVWTHRGSRVDSIPGLDSLLFPSPQDINDRGEIVGGW